MTAKFSFSIIVALFFFSFTQTSNANANCENVQTLKYLWNTKYKTLIKSAPTVESSKQSLMLSKAFCIIEDPSLTGFADFFSYFTQWVTGTFIQDHVEGGAYARIGSRYNEIFLHGPFFWDSSNRYSEQAMDFKRAGTLIHEARHLDMLAKYLNGEHVVCVKGPHKGRRNCDAVFIPDWDKAGAFSYELMIYKHLHANSNFTNKKDLEILANDLVHDTFNHIDPKYVRIYGYSDN